MRGKTLFLSKNSPSERLLSNVAVTFISHEGNRTPTICLITKKKEAEALITKQSKTGSQSLQLGKQPPITDHIQRWANSDQSPEKR